MRAGVDVEVLEARDRVGGRAWRLPVGVASFEAGCEVFDHEHGALRRLAEDVGVNVFEGPAWAAEDPALLEGDELALFRELEGEAQRLAARLDPAHPEELDDAGRLDAQTLAGWLEDRGASKQVLEAAETAISVGSSTVPTRAMSFLAYATKLAAGAAPTGLRLRLVGGPSALATRLADELDGRVRLGAAVAGLEQERSGVAVTLADGTMLIADRVVLAIPLTLQRRLRFEPRLPDNRRRALAEARYGDAVKEAALFAEAPDVAPTSTSDGVIYPSDEDAHILVRFAGAAAAARRVDLGRLAGAEPQAVAGVRWSREPWSRGTYLILGPGHLTGWARYLGNSHGRVHFAGAERSALRSYMEGAVRAGDDAAEEVLHGA
jgi:monoamine oxidase